MVKRLGYSRKKRSVGPTERDERLRAAWRVTVAGALDPRRLVFVDEMGANIALSPLYAYGPKGRRAYAKVPKNRGANTTLLGSMSLRGMGPCLTVEGATTATVFEAYVEQVLAPTLPEAWADIVVANNLLGAHKSERVRELIERRGCKLLFLPPYSPDFNPIEEAFSKIKGNFAKGTGPNPRSPHRSVRGSDFGGQHERRPRILRAWRLPPTCPSSMKLAVRLRTTVHWRIYASFANDQSSDGTNI